MTRRQTHVAVDGEARLINGVATYRGRGYRGWPIEGLLLNSRMANAIFDDANPATRFLWRYPDTGRWDADRNSDELGMVVVLGIFYFGQDERLRDEAAVCRAVEETCGWVLQEGWRNVVIEINNECNVPRYEHEILQPHRVHELIARARRITHGGDRLLVGTSYGGGRVPDDAVCAASDFLLLHGNGVTEPERIAAMVDRTRALPAYAGQPIVFTEDDHFDFDRADNNFTAALSRRAGWGYFDPGTGTGAGGGLSPGNYADGYQNVPVNWAINTPRERAFFGLLREVTGA